MGAVEVRDAIAVWKDKTAALSWFANNKNLSVTMILMQKMRGSL